MVHLVGDCVLLLLRNMLAFELVYWGWISRCIRKLDFVILGPVFSVFFESNSRLDRRRRPTIRKLPPLLALLSCHELRQFLAVDANCNIAEFRKHVFN